MVLRPTNDSKYTDSKDDNVLALFQSLDRVAESGIALPYSFNEGDGVVDACRLHALFAGNAHSRLSYSLRNISMSK